MEKQTAVEFLIDQLESKGKSWENVSIGRIQISIKVEDYLELQKQAKEMEKQKNISLVDAINMVCEEIKKDKGYRLSWEANIAMAFKDAFDFSGYKHDNEVVHEVANKAAAAFLDQLINNN